MGLVYVYLFRHLIFYMNIPKLYLHPSQSLVFEKITISIQTFAEEEEKEKPKFSSKIFKILFLLPKVSLDDRETRFRNCFSGRKTFA